MKKILMLLLVVFLTIGVLFGVKNVIFLIGDGMGLAHVTLTSYFVGKPLEMMKMPYIGFMHTYSANSLVTDSAAAGTALATGYKTFNGMICVTPDGKSVMTLFEAAKKVGKSTGVITTTRVTHATPASFYAHVKSRKEEREIARQLVEGDTIDVAFGGGMKYFSEELLEKAKANGFTVITTREELLNLDPSAVKRVLGIFSRSHLPYYVDGENRPSLAEMTKKAIEILSKNDEGFFLMVEGGRIDHASHGNDVIAMIYDTIEFDEAVKVALEFARKNGDTLVVVTADHETGGLGLSNGKYAIDIEKLRSYSKISIEKLMREITPDNFKEVIKKYYGIDLSDEEVEALKKAFEKGGYAPSNTIGEIISAHALIGWTTHTHTAIMVPVFAEGPGAERFSGTLENVDIPRIIADLTDVPLHEYYFSEIAVGE